MVQTNNGKDGKLAIFSSPEPPGSKGELIIYPCSGVRPSTAVRRRHRLSTTYKDLLLSNHLANQSQNSCEAATWVVERKFI